jgi:hypothetical protein
MLSAFEQELYELNIKLQLAEADAEPHPEGTKLKWVSDTNRETYRVAIVKKNGILEVKSVTDGAGYCHDTTCGCKHCGEIRLSNGQIPPWLKGRPLTKTFFATEAAWRDTLPEGGTVKVTEPRMSDRALRILCTKPLMMRTDGAKLEELEKRFPGAIMLLNTGNGQIAIESMNSDKHFRIYSTSTGEIRKKFSDFVAKLGTKLNAKPTLIAKWRSIYIDLSQLL